MSLDCSKWAWVQIKAGKCETMAQTVVLLKIADMSHDNGKTWAGAAYLAKCTGMSERTVRAALASMDGNLISITPRPGRSAVLKLLLSAFVYEPPTDEEIEDIAPRGRPKKTPEIYDITPEIDDKTPERISDDTVIEPSRYGGLNERADLFGGLPAETKPKVDIEKAFAKFWSDYPRKVAKGAALPAFEKAVARIDHPDPVSVIMNGVISLLAQLEFIAPEYVPHPATWLNQDRFYDETTTRSANNAQRYDPSTAAATRNAARIDALREGAEDAFAKLGRR